MYEKVAKSISQATECMYQTIKRGNKTDATHKRDEGGVHNSRARLDKNGIRTDATYKGDERDVHNVCANHHNLHKVYPIM